MTKKSLFKQTLGVALLLLSGCDVAHNARSDLARLTSSDPFHPAKPAVTTVRPAAKAASTRTDAAKAEVKVASAAAPEPQPDAAAGPDAPVTLIGRSEGDLRTLLGPPTSEEDRAPGKTWHYREGQCRVDIQLYPDVQTRQFGTLAYEVKSDDNTDEGKRVCLAQLTSRARAK